MEVAAVVGVVLHFEEVWEHVDEGPLGVAQGGPFVEVLRQSPQVEGPVDGAGAADHVAPMHEFGPLLAAVDPHWEVPLVPGLNAAAGLHLIPLHVLGGFTEGAIVGTFLKEEDGKVGVFGDAGGEGRPGGTRANDDNVVLHGACAGTAGQGIHLSGLDVGISERGYPVKLSTICLNPSRG